jgi:GTP pyrophosphokinase
MYDWLKDANAPEELFESVRREISTSAVYVYTPKGEVKELPLGATPIDFAYMIHTQLGHTCIGAKVNGAIAALRYHLQNGDVVEILTSKSQRPHRDWLEFVVTGRARTRIRQKLRELDELPQQSGPGESRSVAPPQIAPERRKAEPIDEATREQMVRIAGARDMALQFGKCCNAMPGDGIIGYVTRRHLVTIHRSDCKFLEAADREPERLIAAMWVGDEPETFALRVVMGARPNGLVDLLAKMRPMNLDISRADFRTDDDGESVFECVFSCTEPGQSERVMKSLRQVSGVRHVEEVPADEPMPVA